MWTVAGVEIRVWQVKVVREHKIQLEVESKVRGDKVQTVSGVAWDGWVGGVVLLTRGGRIQGAEKLATKINSINLKNYFLPLKIFLTN